MAKLSDYGNDLKNVLNSILEILNKEESISDSQSRELVSLFVKLDEIKKSIASVLFHENGKEISARDRILTYLKLNVGTKVSGRELAQVGGISEYARRIRELRHEQGGWQISTGMNRPDLRPDEYLLESLEQRPVYERMNAQVWAEVLERDDFTCQNCGWKKGDSQTNNRKFLEVHHKNPVMAQGEPTPENLITLCNVCHDAVN